MTDKTDKTENELLAEKLFCKKQKLDEVMSADQIKEADEFCEGYKAFLNKGKTERMAVEYVVNILKNNGYTIFDKTKKYNPGDKVYLNNRGKAIIMAVVGSNDIEGGMNIIASHIDSPRLDLKPSPLYEDNQIAFLKTHYYGGIKKYQWTALPLALYGTVVLADGSSIEIAIGEGENDPVFCVTDLLPHLANEQMKRAAPELIKGEELNLVFGSRSFGDEKQKDKIKLSILKILNEKYGIVEEDFFSAELTAVPAIKAADVGLDRSIVGSYGQDDRVCAYTSLMAMLGAIKPKKTAVCVLADKEEIGSEGNTGLNSAYLEYFLKDLAKNLGGKKGRDVISASRCMSADVTCCFDPNFPSVSDINNVAFLNKGVAICKYTGARGKASSSDASAEFMGHIRNLLNKNGVAWQSGELGKVDEGGGGTVASYIAALNIDVVDVGVPVLSMHSPFELTSKLDVFSAYKAFLAFVNDK